MRGVRPQLVYTKEHEASTSSRSGEYETSVRNWWENTKCPCEADEGNTKSPCETARGNMKCPCGAGEGGNTKCPCETDEGIWIVCAKPVECRSSVRSRRDNATPANMNPKTYRIYPSLPLVGTRRAPQQPTWRACVCVRACVS